jgi:hypothetical protein
MEGERERDAFQPAFSFLVAAIFSANKSNNITRPSLSVKVETPAGFFF